MSAAELTPRAAGDRGARNQNPRDVGLLALLAEDFQTHGRDPLSPGFWALAVHRFGNWRMDAPAPARAPLTLLYRTAHQVVLNLWKIDMPYDVRIGRRLRLCHHGGVHIGARAVGDDVIVRHAVTLGIPDRQQLDALPAIGNGVELGPGAVVIGDVRVGDGAWIGANTVVGQDVPPGARVIGNPARAVTTGP
jgi:serine O-acetyltransferase